MSSIDSGKSSYLDIKNVENSIEEIKYKISRFPELKTIYEKTLKILDLRRDRLTKYRISESVFAGIASIPSRERALEATVNSLLPQVDQIGIYLNGWSYIPNFLKHPKITIEGFNGKDIGDIGKFFWIDNVNGYYFSCDDDLVYPADYVERSVKKIIEYDLDVVVGWHGSLILEPFEDYYDKNSRRVFSFSSERPYDTPVHILGTGCSAFHTKYFKLSLCDFDLPNMADIYFAIKGQKDLIRFLVIKHNKGEILEYEGTRESSISLNSINQTSMITNTRKQQTQLVSEIKNWKINNSLKLKLLLIGRFSKYKKGGIFKSCNLIKEYLEKNGHLVYTIDVHEELTTDLVPIVDICWIYPGDPDRPDFKNVEHNIEILRKMEVPILVNLSYLYEEKRTRFIYDSIIKYNHGPGSPVLAAVFSANAANDPILRNVKEYITVVPKTLKYEEIKTIPKFDEREGICLGDATKLSNSKIIGGRIGEWIDAIQKINPHINIYAYKQYQGENPHPRLKYVPYMEDGFGSWLSKRKIFVCLNVHLTFEMVALEAQSYGLPVIFRHMPHSLSEYISINGVNVNTPEELAEMVSWIYNNESVWERFSMMSIHNSRAKNIDIADASLEAYLRLAITRAKNLRQHTI